MFMESCGMLSWHVVMPSCIIFLILDHSHLKVGLRNGLKLPGENQIIVGSLQTILLCIAIVWEFPGVGSVVVAVGDSDM